MLLCCHKTEQKREEKFKEGPHRITGNLPRDSILSAYQLALRNPNQNIFVRPSMVPTSAPQDTWGPAAIEGGCPGWYLTVSSKCFWNRRELKYSIYAASGTLRERRWISCGRAEVRLGLSVCVLCSVFCWRLIYILLTSIRALTSFPQLQLLAQMCSGARDILKIQMTALPANLS
jgi:hypothetical protein